MSETKKSTLDRAIESARMECAGARIEGERNSNPQKILYHGNRDSSIPYEEYFPRTFGMGIPEKKCAWCGKVFCPTPEWALGDCCKPTCKFRYDDMQQEEINNARKVVLLNPETLEDVMIFESPRAAAEFAKVTAKEIRDACNGLCVKTSPYGWRWVGEEPLSVRDIIPTYEVERKGKMTVVMCSSACERLEKIAANRRMSKNKVAAEILEKALLKEYEI